MSNGSVAPHGASAESFTDAVAALTTADPHLAAIVEAHGIPQMWTRPPGFASLVLLILEQQVSLASAAATYRKVLSRLGSMTPSAVLASTSEQLRHDGVSRHKDRYLRELAYAVHTTVLDLDALVDADDAHARDQLLRLPGIGRWTADTYLLVSLQRPDLWPVGDRALQVAVAEWLSLVEIPDQGELQRIGERWRPRRSTAARLLWHGYLARRGRTQTPVSVLE